MACSDVCVSMDYDGNNEFYREATRQARKTYRCVECREAIVPGDMYQYATGKNDGGIFVNRTCDACVDIRGQFCCGGWIFGELWESIREQIFPHWNEMKTIDCLAQLGEPAQAKLRADYAEQHGSD